MNRHAVFATFVATIGTTLALASTSALAGKPGGGGTEDPCLAPNLDFPAFAFWRSSGKSQLIYVADATGKCVRLVVAAKSGGGTIQFSYPVSLADNSVVGRVVWVEAPAVVSVDFTVAASTNQISVRPKRTLPYTGTGGGISLSKSGRTLYSTRFLNTGEVFIDKLAIDSNGATAEPVFQSATTDEYIGTIAVNSDESLLYADYKSGGSSTGYQLVYIPLLDGPTSHTLFVLDSNNGSREFTPAADLSANRVAYQKVAVGAGGCDLLVTSDINGVPVYPLQPAYGIKPTWMNSTILADGRVASTRNGCEYTGTIMRTDPMSGVQTALTSGYDPDGK